MIVASVFEIDTLLACRRLQTEPHEHNWGGVAKKVRQGSARPYAVVRVHSPPPRIYYDLCIEGWNDDLWQSRGVASEVLADLMSHPC